MSNITDNQLQPESNGMQLKEAIGFADVILCDKNNYLQRSFVVGTNMNEMIIKYLKSLMC